MSSNLIPVFPLNQVSYVVDRSITNPGGMQVHLLDVNQHLIPRSRCLEYNPYIRPLVAYSTEQLSFLSGHLNAFEEHINNVSVQQWTDGPTEVYIYKQVNISAGSNVQLYHINLGPLEISISYDPETTGIILQAYLTVPIIGTVLVGTVSGSLTEGVSVKVGFGSLLGGEVGAKLEDGHGYLYWDFTAFGNHLQGEVKIF